MTKQGEKRSETPWLSGRAFPEVWEMLLPDPALLDSYQTW